MKTVATNLNRHPIATDVAIQRAFLDLLFDRRFDRITVSDVAAMAGVGRSTFYEHFHGKDALLFATCVPLLLPLANAASGRASRAAVRMMLDHVWQRRGLGRAILDSAAASRLRRTLAAMIGDRLTTEHGTEHAFTLIAAAAAAGQLTILRMWVAGEVAATPGEVADRLLAFSRLTIPNEQQPVQADQAENCVHPR